MTAPLRTTVLSGMVAATPTATATFRYRFLVGSRVVHQGITTDLERREREHRRRCPGGHIKPVGEPTAEEAERRIGLPLDRGPTVPVPALPPTEEAAADPSDARQLPAAPAEAALGPERTPPPAIGGKGAGWEWINWVWASLHDGSVRVNAAGPWLHNIEGEAYVVCPGCFEAFAAGRGIAAATVRNRVVRLGRHRQRASPSGAANVFRAVLADGSRVKGMVFPGEVVWDDDPPPRANASLVGKGR